MSDPYNIEPLSRSTPFKTIIKEDSEKNSQNKHKKNDKKSQDSEKTDPENEKKSPLDDDDSLPHVDEFV